MFQKMHRLTGASASSRIDELKSNIIPIGPGNTRSTLSAETIDGNGDCLGKALMAGKPQSGTLFVDVHGDRAEFEAACQPNGRVLIGRCALSIARRYLGFRHRNVFCRLSQS